MDFDFDAPIDDMANSHQQNAVSMQQLLNNTAGGAHHSQAMQWTATTQAGGHELPSMLPQPQHPMHRPDRKPLAHAPQFLPPQPMHPDMRSGMEHHQSHPMLGAEMKPSGQKPGEMDFQRPDGFQVDLEAAIQMGGLRYADLRKEQAREWFKEKKKNEHMARGEFDRMKRRKKGDTSMTPREKYVRRLKMNQDSAAAARYAQEEYVSILEKLVQTTEQELNNVRQQNLMLQKKVGELQAQADDNVVKFDVQSILDAPEKFKKVDQLALSKWLDMLTTPASVSAQDTDPNFAAGKMGIQSTPAV